MIDIKAIRDAAKAATQEADWRYEPTGQTVWAGNTYMVANIRGWSHFQYLPNGGALQDATGVHIATANPPTVIALCDEIERLRADAARYKKLVAMEADLVEPITIWHYLRNPGDLDAAMEAK